MSLVRGKAGLVTGAAAGIERACAIRLGAEGGLVVVSDLESSRAGGEETVAAIHEAGRKRSPQRCRGSARTSRRS